MHPKIPRQLVVSNIKLNARPPLIRFRIRFSLKSTIAKHREELCHRKNVETERGGDGLIAFCVGCVKLHSHDQKTNCSAHEAGLLSATVACHQPPRLEPIAPAEAETTQNNSQSPCLWSRWVCSRSNWRRTVPINDSCSCFKKVKRVLEPP